MQLKALGSGGLSVGAARVKVLPMERVHLWAGQAFPPTGMQRQDKATSWWRTSILLLTATHPEQGRVWSPRRTVEITGGSEQNKVKGTFPPLDGGQRGHTN